MNSIVASLILQGISMGANAYANKKDAQQAEKAVRQADAENRQRTAYANLQNAFGGRAVPSLMNPQIKSPRSANLLRALGTGASIGSTLINANEAYKNAQAQNRLQDLQFENAQMARDKMLATTAAQAAPLATDRMLGRGVSPTPPQGVDLLRRMGAAGVQYPEGVTSEYGRNVFDATIKQREAEQQLLNLQIAQAQADIDKTNRAGTSIYSGSNQLQIARDAGTNVATLNPFLRGDKAKKLIVEQSGSMSPELLTSAVAGYNEQAAQIRNKFNAILDGAVKQATETSYENGVLALEAGLQAQGYDLSENMLSSFLDRIDAASDAYNFSATEKKQLMQLTTIRANALRAIDTLTDPEAIGQIQEAFGRSEGAIKKGWSYLVGEQEAIGPQAANFLTQLGFLRDTVARYRSGAALTEAEQDFYEGLVGGIFTQPEQLRNTLGELVNQMNREITSLYEVEAISRGKGSY